MWRVSRPSRCSKLTSFWHQGTYVQRGNFQVLFFNEYTTYTTPAASCIITGFIVIAGLIRALIQVRTVFGPTSVDLPTIKDRFVGLPCRFFFHDNIEDR